MSHPIDQEPLADHDDTIGRMLRLAGTRVQVPPDSEARVRQAVLDECRSVARRRRVGRRLLVAGAALATAAAMVLTTRFERRPPQAPPLPVRFASIERLEGDSARLRRPGTAAPAGLSLTDPLSVGDELETGERGRVGLRLAQGMSLRFDRGTRARVVSADAIELFVGAAYVDSGRRSPSLHVRTPFGIVKDIGTQFEVHLNPDSLRVRVRSGMVEVLRSTEVVAARQGVELTIGARGTSTRGIEPYGPEWAWTARLAPAFDGDGRPLSAFLDHVCREQGWTLTYETASLAREASGIILHGSVEGLHPTDALEVVLPTSGLTYRLDRGELTVIRPLSR